MYRIGEVSEQRRESDLSEILIKMDESRNQSVAKYRDEEKT